MNIMQAHSSTVTCVSTDEKDKLAISGSKKGDVIFWEIGPDKLQWKEKYHLFNHEDFVTSIHIKDAIVLTSSLDSSINMYNLEAKLLRTFYHPKGHPILTCVFSNAPLPCIVFFSFRDRVFYSYSINGKQLGSCSEEEGDPLRGITDKNFKYDMIRSPKVVADSYFNDHLVYGTDKGTILIRSLPYFDRPRHLLVATGNSTLTLLISPDRRFLLVGTTAGGLRVLTDPKPISNEQEDNLDTSTGDDFISHAKSM